MRQIFDPGPLEQHLWVVPQIDGSSSHRHSDGEPLQTFGSDLDVVQQTCAEPHTDGVEPQRHSDGDDLQVRGVEELVEQQT